MTDKVMTFEDSVKQRLKGIVADMIPEDRWDAIVRATVADFEKKDLPQLVRDELIAQYKAKIAEEFAKPEWQSRWGAAGTEVSDGVRKLLIESAPLILAQLIGGSMQNVVMQLQHSIQNNIPLRHY